MLLFSIKVLIKVLNIWYLYCVIANNNVTLITFLVLFVDLFSLYTIPSSRFTKTAQTVKVCEYWLYMLIFSIKVLIKVLNIWYLYCVIANNNVTLITFLVLVADLFFIIYYSFTKVYKNCTDSKKFVNIG